MNIKQKVAKGKLHPLDAMDMLHTNFLRKGIPYSDKLWRWLEARWQKKRRCGH